MVTINLRDFKLGLTASNPANSLTEKRLFMDKWADYCIFAKRLNYKGTHVDFVKTHSDLGDRIDTREEMKSRSQVVADLKRGVTYTTIYKAPSDSDWKQGDNVIIETINGVDYIKTLTDKIEADNLDSLPNF